MTSLLLWILLWRTLFALIIPPKRLCQLFFKLVTTNLWKQSFWKSGETVCCLLGGSYYLSGGWADWLTFYCRVSATNCAKIYLSSFSNNSHSFPLGWKVKAELRTEHIYDGFKLLTFLEHPYTRSSPFVLPHDGIQARRFDDMISELNSMIAQHG